MVEQRRVKNYYGKLNSLVRRGYGWIDIVVILDVTCEAEQNAIKRAVLGDVKPWTRRRNVYRQPARTARKRIDVIRRHAREGKVRRYAWEYDPVFPGDQPSEDGVLDEN